MGSASSCPLPPGAEDYDDRGSQWKLMLYIAAGSTFVTAVIALSLIIQHLRRYRSPKEQRQIIRMTFSPVVFAVVALFELYSYAIAQYIDPIGILYESFGLCALFLLYIQYAAPAGTFDDETFETVRAAEERDSTFDWPKIYWILVFQLPIVELLCTALEEATQAVGRYCVQSTDPQFGHIWVEVIQSIGIGAAIMSILGFRGRMKKLMKVRRALSKLIAFKIIVFLQLVQRLVFSILLEKHVIKPSRQLGYNDIFYGIPAVLTCCEMMVLSFGFWYAFSSGEYSSKAKPGRSPEPFWKACLHALNPRDLIMGVARIFPLCGEMRKSGDWKRTWKASKAAIRQRGGGMKQMFQKGGRKFQARGGGGGGGGGDGRYQQIDEGLESLTKPTELHHGTWDSTAYQEANPYDAMAERLAGQEMYQPPAGSPPRDEYSHLAPDSERIDLQRQGRQRSPSDGAWIGQTYAIARTSSPTPSADLSREPLQGRDTV